MNTSTYNIMAQPQAIDHDNLIERAFCVLHAAFPCASLSVINEAVTYYWVDTLTDEQNINNCKYLEDYQ